MQLVLVVLTLLAHCWFVTSLSLNLILALLFPCDSLEEKPLCCKEGHYTLLPG